MKEQRKLVFWANVFGRVCCAIVILSGAIGRMTIGQWSGDFFDHWSVGAAPNFLTTF